MLFYHSVSCNFFTNFFGLEWGLNLRPLGEVQGLSPLRHEADADVALLPSARDVVVYLLGTMHSGINPEIFRESRGVEHATSARQPLLLHP